MIKLVYEWLAADSARWIHRKLSMNIIWISRLARAAVPVAVLALVVLSWVPGSERPHTGFPGPIEHAVAYVLVSAGLVVSFPKRSILIALALIGLAAALEVGQIWIPGRAPKAIDFAASAGAALVGLALGGIVWNCWIVPRVRN